LDEQKDLTVIHQANLGGAGGFHTGIKTAYEKGYDWIWCMDDDGLPHIDALEQLLKYEKKSDGILNSLVVSKSDADELVFGLEDYTNKIFYTKVSETKNQVSIDGGNFFNGTLIHKNTISKVGLPNPLFFIYGDDLEYYFRIKSKAFTIKTIPTSIIDHPEQKHIYVGKWKLFYRINYLNLLGVNYVPRNLIAIWYLYEEYSFRRLLKTYVYDIGGLLFLQKKILFAIKYIASIFAGIPFIFKLKNEKLKI